MRGIERARARVRGREMRVRARRAGASEFVDACVRARVCSRVSARACVRARVRVGARETYASVRECVRSVRARSRVSESAAVCGRADLY